MTFTEVLSDGLRAVTAEAKGHSTLFVHLLNFFFDFGAFISCEISRSALLEQWSAVEPKENFV